MLGMGVGGSKIGSLCMWFGCVRFRSFSLPVLLINVVSALMLSVLDIVGGCLLQYSFSFLLWLGCVLGR